MNRGKKKAEAAKSSGPPSVRLTPSLPSYWTVNFQLLFWLFANDQVGFGHDRLPLPGRRIVWFTCVSFCREVTVFFA